MRIRGDGLPDYLLSTFELLLPAYPQGIPDSDYHAVIKVLLEKCSVRNCKDVVERFVDASHGVYNDVLGVAGDDPLVDEADLARVRALLRQSGYDAWLAEPD